MPGTVRRECQALVYLDTGHKPRSDAERQNSKFVQNFGKSYKIDYKGLELDVIDFAEPKNKSEKRGDGLRRGPAPASATTIRFGCRTRARLR